ncbi:hypothetical protein PHYPSEUDO_006550 [Phytophthora pseudosyringae]|uniref:Uncharacterized protein n=1 Tax=Phytophthora pseudosyringae TaxID=221518 RepID=A0A8T1VI91_9STRA|nr:hypothetical protein PHYPSEUDO_006550 [Phytophthora pseudosyringae]
MPTSSVASGIVASIRSRPGSSVASKATAEEEHVGEGDAPEPTPTAKLATVALADRSLYNGEVNDDGVPDGMGVLLSVFGTTYSGAMKHGKKHGAGVELQTNGAAYSGEFRDGAASGDGVYVGTLGDTYVGQWEDGARHGVGVAVDAEAVMTVTHFNLDEPELADSEDTGLSWEGDVQPYALRAVLAEKAAIRNQELARQRHIDAVVQAMTAVGKLRSESLDTPEAVEAFEVKEELETAEFVRDQSDQMSGINAVAGELKLVEAQLTQRQKELRAEITTTQQELSSVAKYCALAETREAQVREAERTLATLQRQLEALQVPSTPCHVREEM